MIALWLIGAALLVSGFVLGLARAEGQAWRRGYWTDFRVYTLSLWSGAALLILCILLTWRS